MRLVQFSTCLAQKNSSSVKMLGACSDSNCSQRLRPSIASRYSNQERGCPAERRTACTMCGSGSRRDARIARATPAEARSSVPRRARANASPASSINREAETTAWIATSSSPSATSFRSGVALKEAAAVLIPQAAAARSSEGCETSVATAASRREAASSLSSPRIRTASIFSEASKAEHSVRSIASHPSGAPSSPLQKFP